MTPDSYVPEFAPFKAQSTRLGPRPGFASAPWRRRGFPACHAADSVREDPRPEQKSKNIPGKKCNLLVFILRHDAKSRQISYPNFEAWRNTVAAKNKSQRLYCPIKTKILFLNDYYCC